MSIALLNPCSSHYAVPSHFIEIRLSHFIECTDLENLFLRFEFHTVENYRRQISEAKHHCPELRKFLPDFIIECRDNIEINVHKCVLAQHSEVFRAMFSHDYADSREGKRFGLFPSQLKQNFKLSSRKFQRNRLCLAVQCGPLWVFGHLWWF